jgi:endonuclease III
MEKEKLLKTRLYSEELGIDLSKKKPAELFKWFIASILFGARISETTAKKTYRTFLRYRLTTPLNILRAGWGFLVNPVMREGGYARYDEKTSDKFLKICEKLMREYKGNLNVLHDCAKDSRDLEEKLQQFYGIGPVTANIFLRELRPYWKKANPEPLAVVRKLAKRFGINLRRYNRKSITFARIEAGLIRARKITKE